MPGPEQEAQQRLGRAARRVEAPDHAAEARRGVAGAGRRAAASGVKRANAGGIQRAVVGVVGGVGRVEDQGAQARGVANRIGLTEQGAVGVPVEGDAWETKRGADGVQVRSGFGAGVGGVVRPELLGALADRDVFLDDPLLQRRAVDRTRRAGAALVEEDEVAAAQQRRQGGLHRAHVFGRGRGEAGAAVDGDDRAEGRPPPVRARAQCEADLGRSQRWVRAPQRDFDLSAAQRARGAEVAAVQPHRCLRKGRGREERGRAPTA